MKNKKVSLAGLSLVLAILACNLPNTTQSLTVEQQAGTSIAATLTAQPGPELGATATATTAAIATVTGGSTATATRPVKATVTPTYSTPILTVLQQTNCREGPGQDYQVVFTYLAKVQLEIVGRYDPTNFWLVKSPQSKSGTCWLWGEYTEASGSYWVVPTLTPPPTATQPPPQAPSITKWDYSCAGGNMTFSVEWQDKATNEAGYRVFRDGESVAELPANSTSWTETIPLKSGKSVSYYLQVYGPSGEANSSIMKLDGC
jgi:hypothetical protein